MMAKMTGLLAVGVLLTSILIAAAPARAEVQYPWCAQYANKVGGGTNCGFVTLAQCRATASGLGGICYANPAYPSRRGSTRAY